MGKIPKKKRAVRSATRTLAEGNVLWQKFRELGQSRCAAFRQLLASNRVPLSTFYADTSLKKDLSKLPQKRALLYQSFFSDLCWKEIVPVQQPPELAQQQEKQRAKQTLASRLGLNR